MEWIGYLKLPANEYNCWTLIEKICLDNGTTVLGSKELEQYHFKHNWGLSFSYEQIESFIKLNNWKLIELQEIQEFDLIVFTLRNTRPQHFGIYVGTNQFIHHRKTFKIDMLDDFWRGQIKYIIRWKNI